METAQLNPVFAEQIDREYWRAQAEEARSLFNDARRHYATFAKEESKLEAERPKLLAEIKAKYMDGTHAHMAATPAQDAAKVDPEYLNHLTLLRDTVAIKDNWWTEAKSAQLRCELAIAYLGSL